MVHINQGGSHECGHRDDPHKASHTAVAIDEAEDEISSVKVRATRRQVEQLVRWAEPSRSGGGPSSLPAGLAICSPGSPWLTARWYSTSRPPWPLGSGCSAPVVPTRTTPTTPTRSLSPPLGPSLRCVEPADHSPGAPAPGQAQPGPREPSDSGGVSPPRPLG